jgi:acyl-CoA synthetase (AMP-forming)/AMP-acid ligase II
VLHEVLDRRASEQADGHFAASADRVVRNAQAAHEVRRLASALHDAGVEPGERIAVLAPNGIEFVELIYAASRAGVALVPLNTRLATDEWTFIIDDAQPRVLFVADSFVDRIDALRGSLSNRAPRCVSIGAAAARRPGWDAWPAWLDRPSADVEHTGAATPDSDVLQLYTSATTGRPKGAQLPQRAVEANIVQISTACGFRPDERSLVVAPMFHAAVLPSTLAPLASGGNVFIQSEFRPAEVVRALETEQISFAVLVPAVLQACLSHDPELAAHRFGALRQIYYGSSPIAERTLRRALAAFGCGFVQSYGMTEASQAVTFLTPEDHLRGLDGQSELLLSAGRAAPETEIQIVDAFDAPLPPGVPGEVVVRGPQVMRGYWNQPSATADALSNGWLHTGDVGTLDAAGYLTIRDRLKDMIVSGGENVYPRAIEEVLARHPDVADVAVIGVPDARWGESVKAVVVARAGSMVDPGELIAFCRAHLGGFEVPRSIDLCDALPRNAAGKVLKRMLREPYWAEHERQVAGA